MQFYWKCQVCKQAIKENLVEEWIDGRKARYHKKCLEKQNNLLIEADRILGKLLRKH
jgi:hypothetical protein